MASGRKRLHSLDENRLLCSQSPTKKPTVTQEFHSVHTTPAPLSTDEEPKRMRDACDYTIRISMEDAKAGNTPRMVRVYADGVYDMFHNGHARQLKQAKTLLPNTYLIVGVNSQAATEKMKGRTVVREMDRFDTVRHCRYIDEVIFNAPWKATDELIKENKIDFVAHDELPYNMGNEEDVYKYWKDKGMFLVTQRTEGISTTDVVANIIKDYDLYVRQNLAMGYTAKELNVSFMKEKKLILGEKYDWWMDKGKELRREFIDRGQEIILRWERNSKGFISNFLEVFGKEGRLSTWFTEGTNMMVRAITPILTDSPPAEHSGPPSPMANNSACGRSGDSDDEDS